MNGVSRRAPVRQIRPLPLADLRAAVLRHHDQLRRSPDPVAGQGDARCRDGWSATEFGLVNSAFQGGYALTAAVFWLARRPPRHPYRLCVVDRGLECDGSRARLCRQLRLGLLAARVGLGLGEGGNFPSAIKAVTQWFPARARLCHQPVQCRLERRRDPGACRGAPDRTDVGLAGSRSCWQRRRGSSGCSPGCRCTTILRARADWGPRSARISPAMPPMRGTQPAYSWFALLGCVGPGHSWL